MVVCISINKFRWKNPFNRVYQVVCNGKHSCGGLESLFRKMGIAGYIENNMFLFFQDVQTQAIALQMGKIFRHTIKGLKGFGEFPRYKLNTFIKNCMYYGDTVFPFQPILVLFLHTIVANHFDFK